MKLLRIAAVVVAATLLSSAASFADDTTTTTTTHTETASGPGVYVGVPGVAGVHVGAPPVERGCTSQSTTRTNEDTGASSAVTRSDCRTCTSHNPKRPRIVCGAFFYCRRHTVLDQTEPEGEEAGR